MKSFGTIISYASIIAGAILSIALVIVAVALFNVHEPEAAGLFMIAAVLVSK